MALVLGVLLLLGQCSADRSRQQAQQSTSVAATPPVPAEGVQGYLAYCAMCHGETGAGDGPLAEKLREQRVVVARLDDAGRLQELGRDGVRRVVVTGGGHTGRSNIMPAWGEKLDRKLVEDIVTFVLDLPAQKVGVPAATVQKYLEAPAGAPEAGRKLFVFYCSGCHGLQGRGDGPNGDSLRVHHNIRPRDLTGASYIGAKTDEDLYNVIALGGGHMGKSVFMPAWTFTLQPADIKNLVAYIRVLSHTPSRP
jgi:mono/diheme cytochrome c family protein